MEYIPYVFELTMPREQGERPNHVHYTCPECHNQLEHCTCAIPPSFLYGCEESMPPLPQGFAAECDEDGAHVTITITESSDGLSREEFEARKAQLIDELLDWCMRMPKTRGWLPEV